MHLRSPAFCSALAQLQECDSQGTLCSVLKQPHLHKETEHHRSISCCMQTEFLCATCRLMCSGHTSMADTCHSLQAHLSVQIYNLLNRPVRAAGSSLSSL